MTWRDLLEDTALRDFTGMEEEGWRAIVRRGYEDRLKLFRELNPTRIVEWIGGGREPHPLIALKKNGAGEKALVRSYRRGGMMRHFNRSRYFVGHRAFEELLATERARQGGVSVPVVLAAVEYPSAVGYSAAISTLWIEGVTGALEWLARRDGSDLAALRRIGEQIGRMHAAGVAHPDLNLSNLLIGSRDLAVTIVDFDRARLHPGQVPATVRTANLQRLARSARQLGVRFRTGHWTALRAGYGDAWPVTDSRG